MNKIILPFTFKSLAIIFIFLTFTVVSYSQNTDYDKKYSAEYVLKDIKGNVINRLMLYRNNNKLKFVKTENKGKEDELITEMYILKDEQKTYTIMSSKKIKLGYKQTLDMTNVGMFTGIYIFDLGNDGSVFKPSLITGSGDVLGKSCVQYTIITAPGGGSFYYMYQDNLMLKRFVGTTEEGNTLEAISYDTGVDIPESTFTIPTDVQYIDN